MLWTNGCIFSLFAGLFIAGLQALKTFWQTIIEITKPPKTQKSQGRAQKRKKISGDLGGKNLWEVEKLGGGISGAQY